MTAPVPTVFVVDDDASVRRALTRLFTSVGLRVETFSGGAVLIARAPADEHGCLLLDIKMPKINGLEVLQRIREESFSRRLPVVILTSSKEDQDLIRGYELGANSYIRKPVDFEQFTQAIKELGIYWMVLNEPPPPKDSKSTTARVRPAMARPAPAIPGAAARL